MPLLEMLATFVYQLGKEGSAGLHPCPHPHSLGDHSITTDENLQTCARPPMHQSLMDHSLIFDLTSYLCLTSQLEIMRSD
ncbi:hypothetical protein TNCT_689991 [Trichonephila clavata]|uniref:Uncharacterized protein n=1 Tax=Trichonephila clavata TaxID=2740835 RepID=A0A8X6IJ68_TRICU|nr:hypothetical protein TNCT_689991 [Trichonephila clavata]